MFNIHYLTLVRHDKSDSQIVIDDEIIVDLDPDGRVLGIEGIGVPVDFVALMRVLLAIRHNKEVKHDMDLVDQTKEDHVPHGLHAPVLGAVEGS